MKSSRRWLLLAGLWTALPLLLSVGGDLATGQTPTFPGFLTLVYVAFYWWGWIPLTPLVTRLGRRFPIRGRPALPHAFVHVIASWLIALGLNLVLALATGVLPLGYSAENALQQAVRVGHGMGALSQILYWLVLATSALFGAYQHAQQRDTLLAEARLQVLKGQVHPHFLFNTLNTVSTLIDEDTQAAQRMIAHLSELLRASFRGHATHEVSLGEELALVDLYLNIEKVRFEDRLRPHIEIEEETRAALVPHLLLQPLVENAIHHGISRDSTAGELTVSARRVGDDLLLRVEDDGVGPSSRLDSTEQAAAEGIGLANTRARLRELYGDRGRFELRPRQPRGSTVEIDIPFHLETLATPQ